MGIICVEDRKSRTSEELETAILMRSQKAIPNSADMNAKYYIMKDIIGRGQFGFVRKAYLKSDNSKFVAIKSIPKKRLGKNLKTLHAHHKNLATIDHPNIVKFYETYEDETHFHSVMQYVPGNELVNYNAPRGTMPEIEVSQIMGKALSAIDCLHSKGIVHRDIKPQNFLYADKESKTEIILIDFGFSRLMKKFELLETRIGTPFYLAPEVIQGEYDHRSEYWSLGVMMHELLVGKFPFSGQTTPVVLKEILKTEKVNLEGSEWLKISSDAKDLVKRLLEKDLTQRISAAEALNHPWIKMGQDAELIEQHKSKKRKEFVDRLGTSTSDSDSTEQTNMIIRTEESSELITQSRAIFDTSRIPQTFYRGPKRKASIISVSSENDNCPASESKDFGSIPKEFLEMSDSGERRTIA